MASPGIVRWKVSIKEVILLIKYGEYCDMRQIKRAQSLNNVTVVRLNINVKYSVKLLTSDI